MFSLSQRHLKKVLFLADTQAGSRLSPYPPGLPLSKGGGWELNEWQKYLWDKWENMMDLLPRRLDGFFHLGETVQGPANQHHPTYELVTSDRLEQAAIAEAMLGPIVDKVKRHSSGVGRAFWVCRGSGWHEGPYGRAADDMARNLGAQKFPDGEWAGDVLDLPIGPFNVNAAHHHPVFLRYPTSALERELQWFSESDAQAETEDGTIIEDYDLVARGHVHKYRLVDTGKSVAFTCPGWQLQMRYVLQKNVAKAWPDLGFVLVYFDSVAKKHGRRGIWVERILYPHPRRKAARL